MGVELLVALLVGFVALVGSGGGGSDDTDAPENDINDDQPDVSETPDSQDDQGDTASGVEKASLSGTDTDDELFGDDLIGDIDAGDGDDLIVSFGATGVMNGGAGDDTLLVNTGGATMTGGAGADVFVVIGDEGSETPTDAVVTDFDPREDHLYLGFQQSEVANGDVLGTTETVLLKREDIETANGPAVKFTFAPSVGFEAQTQGIGFASVTIEGQSLSDLEDANILVGRESTNTLDAQVDTIEALSIAVKNYNDFVIGSGEDDTDFPTQKDALFGLAGDDVLVASTLSSGAGTDLYGGNDDDTLRGGFVSAAFFGGDGDDTLITEADATLTGGAGADTFVVLRDPEFPEPTIITDFEAGVDTLDLGAVLFNIETDDGIPGTNSVLIEDVTRDGVDGAFITTQHENSLGTVRFGPTLFLVGVSASDLDGETIGFDPVLIFPDPSLR